MLIFLHMYIAAPLFMALVTVAFVSSVLLAICTVKSVACTKYTNEYGMAGRIVWQHALRFNLQLWFSINLGCIALWIGVICLFIKFVGFV